MKLSKPGIGLPKMHLEPGERRVFLPEFTAALQEMGFSIFLENDYGASIDLEDWDYHTQAKKLQFADLETVYAQDLVLILRFPGDEMIRKMTPGACLISMLHYPTRPQRVELLHSRNLHAISLDTIMNDSRQRMVENLPSVAWNGMRISIRELSKIFTEPGFMHPDRPPIRVTLIGAGAVGKTCHPGRSSLRRPKDEGRDVRAGHPGSHGAGGGLRPDRPCGDHARDILQN